MKGTLIAVGTELVDGDVINTNTAYLASACQALGITIVKHLIIGDDEALLMEEFQRAYQASDLVILSGGLGPTYDDMTRSAVAKVLGKKLVIDEKSMEAIDAFFRENNYHKTPNNDRQALILEDGKPLANKVGLATGSFLRENGKIVILLPGPPHEMQWVFENEVKAKLDSKALIKTEMLHFFGIGEAELEDRLSFLMKESDTLRIAPYAKGSSVTIKLTAKGKEEKQLEARLEKAINEVTTLLAGTAYERGEDDTAKWILNRLSLSAKTLAVAESCTGGLISSCLTDRDGASKVYKGGLCAYQEEQKTRLLGVSKERLKTHSVYSAEVVGKMAEGTRALFQSDYAIATSGLVGEAPEGLKKGSIYYAFSDERETKTYHYEVYQGEYRKREALKEAMTKKVLIDFYLWQRERD